MKSDTTKAPHVPWYTRLWVWLKTHWYVPVALLSFATAWAFAKLAGTTAGDHDAVYAEARLQQELERSRKRADAEIKAAQARTEAAIEKVEADRLADLAALEDAQAEEYVEIRRGGPKAAADWINKNLGKRGL